MSTFIFGYIIGTILTLLLLYIGYMYYEFKHKNNQSRLINKQKILSYMNQRMDALSIYLDHDYGSNLTGYHEAHREVRYWRDCINRGVFDEEDVDD